MNRYRWWAAGLVFLIVGVTAVTIEIAVQQAISPQEQSQIHGAIVADISYRNSRMVTRPRRRFVASPFPTEVTPRQKRDLDQIPTESVEDFTGTQTTVVIKSLNRNGRVMDVTFTETTTMIRPSPGPSYEYAIPQSATLERSGGKWLVATVAFAPGSGMDGTTCKAKSWAGNC